MEEGRWAARLLSEIGSARAAIAASYLNLWRTGAGLRDLQPDEPEAAAGEPHEATSPSPPSTTTEGAEQA